MKPKLDAKPDGVAVLEPRHGEEDVGLLHHVVEEVDFHRTRPSLVPEPTPVPPAVERRGPVAVVFRNMLRQVGAPAERGRADAAPHIGVMGVFEVRLLVPRVLEEQLASVAEVEPEKMGSQSLQSVVVGSAIRAVVLHFEVHQLVVGSVDGTRGFCHIVGTLVCHSCRCFLPGISPSTGCPSLC